MGQITRDRYRSAEGGDVFDTWGGYYISRELWQQRMDEGRSDRAYHDFVFSEDKPTPIGQGWFTQHVVCTRCGEERDVIPGPYFHLKREPWCVQRRGLLARLFGARA